MKKNKFIAALALAISSSGFLAAIPEVKAADLVALHTSSKMPDATIKANAEVSREASGEKLLARGLARLANARGPEDFQIAYNYFKMSAKNGNAEAQFQLAIMQLDNEYVRQDEETAIRWLEKASKGGHRQAAIALDYVVNGGGDIGC